MWRWRIAYSLCVVRVIVIGAGVIGAAIAEAMARRGAEVTVLDMRGPGRGASQASAGILAPFTEAQSGSDLLALGRRSLDLFDDFIAGVTERSGRAIEYDRTGTVEVALDAADVERLRATARWLEAEGIERRWLEADDLQRFEPSVNAEALGGLHIDRHGFLGVPALVGALVHAARLAGALFESSVEAVAVSSQADGVTVQSGDREWAADAVVVAAGSWSGRVRIDDVPRLPVRPVRGQLLHLEWRRGPAPARVVWGPGCYTVPWPDGTLLVGATVEEAGFDETSSVEGVRMLTTSVEALLPASGGAALRDIRVGLRPATTDGLPLVGLVAPRVAVATGHYRNGILLAPFTADVITRLVLDGDADAALSATDPGRAGLDG